MNEILDMRPGSAAKTLVWCTRDPGAWQSINHSMRDILILISEKAQKTKRTRKDRQTERPPHSHADTPYCWKESSPVSMLNSNDSEDWTWLSSILFFNSNKKQSTGVQNATGSRLIALYSHRHCCMGVPYTDHPLCGFILFCKKKCRQPPIYSIHSIICIDSITEYYRI